jgi:hypothetical protein
MEQVKRKSQKTMSPHEKSDKLTVTGTGFLLKATVER